MLQMEPSGRTSKLLQLSEDVNAAVHVLLGQVQPVAMHSIIELDLVLLQNITNTR